MCRLRMCRTPHKILIYIRTMKNNLLYPIYGILLIFCLQSADAAPQPSFECAKATTKLEKLICSDDDLALLDAELAQLVGELKIKYTDVRYSSFLKGHRAWLKLRANACVLELEKLSQDDQVECLQSVYDERIKELREQNSMASSIDIDDVLDAPRNLTAYSPEAMSSLLFHYKKDMDWDVRRIPKTCRELYAINSGAWKYSSDTIGSNSQTNAFTICAFHLFSAQDYGGKNQDVSVDFSDYTQYSNEFSCLVGFPGCRDLFRDYPVSFKTEEEKGLLKIETGIANRSHENSTDDEKALTLQIDKNKFSIAGTIYAVHDMKVGDFTKQGRQEAILRIGIYPSQGTYRDNRLILAYYDKDSRSIRPEIVNSDSLFILRSKTMPERYYLETRLPHTLTDSYETTIDGKDFTVQTFEDTDQNPFNQDLRRRHLEGEITSCSTLIDVPAGVARGNHSYGGYCVFKDAIGEKNVVVCEDQMLGRFVMKDRALDAKTTDYLVKYVVTNCFGG